MRHPTALISIVVLAGTMALGISSVEAAGVILRDRFPGSKCCHMRFPAISENTPGEGRAVFDDESSTAVFDTSLPCDYDPVNCCAHFCDDVTLSLGCSEHRTRDLR
jgi:hypothetical protein